MSFFSSSFILLGLVVYLFLYNWFDKVHKFVSESRVRVHSVSGTFIYCSISFSTICKLDWDFQSFDNLVMLSKEIECNWDFFVGSLYFMWVLLEWVDEIGPCNDRFPDIFVKCWLFFPLWGSRKFVGCNEDRTVFIHSLV